MYKDSLLRFRLSYHLLLVYFISCSWDTDLNKSFDILLETFWIYAICKDL